MRLISCRMTLVVFIFVVSILFLAYVISIVDACGIVTHSTVCMHARDYYYVPRPGLEKYAHLLKKYEGSFFAGCPFPDYLYQCGKNHDAGEMAHWPPWQAAAASYIRNLPQGEDRDKLTAFLFGAISHSIADTIWHGIRAFPYGRGFIRALGSSNFGCKGSLCHSAHEKADVGAEFVVAWQTRIERWLSPTKWEVPTHHLVEIFARMNVTVPSLWINECHALFLTAAEGVMHSSDVVFWEQTWNAPWMVEELLEYPMGGIEDMAIWTGRVWNRFALWIEEGPPHHLPVDDPLFFTRTRTFLPTRQGETSMIKQRMLYRKILYPLYYPSDKNTKNTVHISTRPLATWEGTDPVEYFGSSMVSITTKSGKFLLAVGSPGFNRQKGKVSIFNLVTGQFIQTLLPGHPEDKVVYVRFGASLTTVDWNKDGNIDLVVGAPSYGWNWQNVTVQPSWKYRGAVMIFFGSMNGTFSTFPNVILKGDSDLHFMGSSLTSGKIGNDTLLVVGSPHYGKTSISGGRVLVFSPPKTRYILDLHGDTFSWFGYHVKIDTRHRLLLIGAPFFGADHKRSVGALYGYNLSTGTLRFKLVGTLRNGEFGKGFDVSDNDQLVVSAPAGEQCHPIHKGGCSTLGGVVYIVTNYSHLQGTMDIQSPKVHLVGTIRSKYPGERLGTRIMSSCHGNHIILSAPLHSSGLKQEEHEVGAIYNVTSGIYRRGNKPMGRFGASLACIHPIIATAYNNNNTNTIAVGAPRASASSERELVGSVVLLDG